MNSSRTKDQTLLIIFAISIMLFGLDHQQILNTPKDLVMKIISPVQTPFYFLRHNLLQLYTGVQSIPSQQRRLKDMERRLSELSLKANKAEELEKEIATIKANTKITSTDNYTSVTAKVISLTRFAIINRGSKDGLKPGLAVITNDSLVGIIKSVLDHRSLVQLLKDQETNLDVVTLGGTTGLLKYAENTLVIQEVLQKNELSPQEPIYTKGTQDIPNGLLVGYVNKIDEKAASVYKQAEIDQAHQITDQSYVIVAVN